MKSDLVDITAALIHATPAAVLISASGEEAKAVWLPKSRIEVHETGKSTQTTLRNGQIVMLPVVEVTLPQRLAAEKGLI